MLLVLLQGEEVPRQVILPLELVVRQSCGCFSPVVLQAAIGQVTATGQTFEVAFAALREHILSEMVQAVEAPPVGIDHGWAEQLLNVFFAELKGELPNAFLPALDEILRQVEAGGQCFPSRQLVPGGILSHEKRYTMVVEPLYFREEQIGFVLFEMGPREGVIYEALRG